MKKYAFFTFLSLLTMTQLFAQNSERFIEVRGKAVETVVADNIYYVIALAMLPDIYGAPYYDDGEEARQVDTAEQKRILNTILSNPALNIEAFENGAFQVNPISEEKGPKMLFVKVKDYQSLELLVSKLREYPYFIGRICKAEYSDSVRMEQRLKAKALRNAKSSAENMARSAGSRIVRVISIEDHGVKKGGSNNYFDGWEWQGMEINPLSVEFTAEVVVRYAIK